MIRRSACLQHFSLVGCGLICASSFGCGQLSLTIGCTVDLLHPASALVRHWWSPFDSSLQQLIMCPRFSSVASLASHWSSRGLFVDHRHWRVFDGRGWIVMLSGEECPNFAISELGGGGEWGGCSRRLDGAARYVTSHVNSTARGQRSGGSHWGGEHSCCLGICVLLAGF